MGRTQQGGRAKKRAAARSDWLTLWAIGRYDLGCSEAEFWGLTFEEFNALCERDIERQDQLEYLAALSPWATFNVNRRKDAPFLDPIIFMMRRQARLSLDSKPEPVKAGRAAVLVAPAPAQGMRWAKPGERPPSKYAPGERDDVIERFDIYRTQFYAGKVTHGR